LKDKAWAWGRQHKLPQAGSLLTLASSISRATRCILERKPNMPHPLHEVISDLLAPAVPPNCILIKDPACRGDQCIPLFCSAKRSFATEFCNVDLLILHDKKIRVIVEIEEANVKPTQIAGKFLTSALASHFIHDRHGEKAIPKDMRVTFLQFADTTGLPVGSSKREQWKNIERSIQSILPLRGVVEYRLFCGDVKDFQGDARHEVIDAITRACR